MTEPGELEPHDGAPNEGPSPPPVGAAEMGARSADSAGAGPVVAALVPRPPRRWRPDERVAEYLSLRASRALAAKLGPERRDALQELLGLAAQRRVAGESLWYSGHRAEGLRLVEHACRIALGAMREAAEGAGFTPESAADAVRSLGFEPAVVELATILEAEDPPRRERLRDREIDATDEKLFERLIAAERSAASLLQPASASPLRLKWLRLRRIALVVGAFAALMTALVWYLYEPPRIEISATDEHPARPATLAFDGNPATEWLGNDRVRPTLEIRLYPARSVEEIRLLNGFNPPYNDRAIRRYRLTATKDDAVVQQFAGEFRELSTSPEWVTYALGSASVDHIRLQVESFHGTGAALKEIVVVQAQDGSSAGDEPPAAEVEADEAPADEAATDEAPADEAATDEAPTDEAATDEAATDEAPADEAPSDEAPAE